MGIEVLVLQFIQTEIILDIIITYFIFLSSTISALRRSRSNLLIFAIIMIIKILFNFIEVP